MKSAKFAVLLLILITVNIIKAQDFPSEYPLELKIYPFEFPYNISGGYSYFGMNQLVQNSESWTIFIHETFGNLLISSGCNDLFAFFFLGIYNISIDQHLPLGSQWMYQEAHRSVLGSNDVESADSIYEFDFNVSDKKVYEVSDSELAYFHDTHPVEFIRSVTAGSELTIVKSTELKKNYFYSGKSLKFILPNLWINQINLFWNLQFSSISTINDSIDDLNTKEKNIKDRDFSGPEFTTWVYELYHMDEPYSNRGIHPSGTGYNRYISYSDLSKDEIDYLTRVTYLMLLNFASPQMLGINRMEISETENIYLNFSFMTFLTPFGYTVDFNLMSKIKVLDFSITYHSYVNNDKYFPGVDFEIYRLPLWFINDNFYAGGLISVWNQPDELLFNTEKSMLGGMIKGELIYKYNDKFEFFSECGFKTEGWVAGQLSLDNEFTFGIGLNVLMY
ncbi:MAG: hypothetical protein JW982_09875 [Spirochaetes bacterium]|nr:hypothetical protein [Spirochaetota bacterium]